MSKFSLTVIFNLFFPPYVAYTALATDLIELILFPFLPMMRAALPSHVEVIVSINVLLVNFDEHEIDSGSLEYPRTTIKTYSSILFVLSLTFKTPDLALEHFALAVAFVHSALAVVAVEHYMLV